MQSVEGPYTKAIANEKNRYITGSFRCFNFTLQLEHASAAHISARLDFIITRVALVEIRAMADQMRGQIGSR